MKLVLRPYVEKEIAEAADWYEERQPGLRLKFINSVGETFSRIEENPWLYQPVHLDIRRAPVHRFPYGVFYAPIEGDVHVLAVVNDARHPSVWRRRR
jgi:plasmid stabilization system protein ParE